MTALSQRQRECLIAIEKLMRKHGYCPSIRQICDEMGGIGTNAVFNHLIALEGKGYIHREAGQARTIRILERA